MAKRKLTKPSLLSSRDGQRIIQLVEYEITSEPILDRRYMRLPDHVKDAFDRLHWEAQEQPLKAIPELLDWIEKYPDIPILYNYLSVAYSSAGQNEKAEEVIHENYRRNPDYLFARLNYAEVCRARGDYDEIAEIFEHKFDLKFLYPKRKKFHISEVANFMGLMGIYFLGTGDPDTAEKYYAILKQIAPEYPVTKLLRRNLHHGSLTQMLRRVLAQMKSGSRKPGK
ncbi:MAG: hypothetical protein ACYTA5_23075 [Planctomycetota bacterium]|jgi:tetratricopeptide (TPR) repeat protein